jgi:hypothetical protein
VEVWEDVDESSANAKRSVAPAAAKSAPANAAPSAASKKKSAPPVAQKTMMSERGHPLGRPGTDRQLDHALTAKPAQRMHW